MTAWPFVSYGAAGSGRLAQLVRALPSHGRGQRFKSFVAHHSFLSLSSFRKASDRAQVTVFNRFQTAEPVRWVVFGVCSGPPPCDLDGIMDNIEILATCQHWQNENRLTIAKGDKTSSRCDRCKGILLSYETVNGYIYILSNPKMRGFLKIGFSTRSVQERVAELSSATGVPAAFELEAYFLSTDPEAHEQQIHTRLAEHRIRGREFFELPVPRALQVAESICKRSPAYLNPRNGLGRTAIPMKGGWDWGPGKR